MCLQNIFSWGGRRCLCLHHFLLDSSQVPPQETPTKWIIDLYHVAHIDDWTFITARTKPVQRWTLTQTVPDAGNFQANLRRCLNTSTTVRSSSSGPYWQNHSDYLHVFTSLMRFCELAGGERCCFWSQDKKLQENLLYYFSSWAIRGFLRLWSLNLAWRDVNQSKLLDLSERFKLTHFPPGCVSVCSHLKLCLPTKYI